MEMLTNYVYLFAVVLLFLIIVIKAMDELVYQRKIKKIVGIIICYPFYVIIAYYLLVKFQKDRKKIFKVKSKTLQLDKDHVISFYDLYQARSF